MGETNFVFKIVALENLNSKCEISVGFSVQFCTCFFLRGSWNLDWKFWFLNHLGKTSRKFKKFWGNRENWRKFWNNFPKIRIFLQLNKRKNREIFTHWKPKKKNQFPIFTKAKYKQQKLNQKNDESKTKINIKKHI